MSRPAVPAVAPGPEHLAADRELVRMVRDALLAEGRARKHRHDIVAYAQDVHGVWLWGKQAEAARALLQPPHRVMIKSANGVGKTALCGIIGSWFHQMFDPGMCVISGPRFDQIKDTTFKEIRNRLGALPAMRDRFLPKNPEVYHHQEHFIKGTTAGDPTAFQGFHSRSLLMLFEECTGVAREFWEAARYILAGGEQTYWVAILNPTDPGSHAHAEELSGQWHVLSISAFEHPNIHEGLAGGPDPIPGAVNLRQLAANMVADDAAGEWVRESEVEPTDVDLWDPATYHLDSFTPEQAAGARTWFPERYWRPGPVGEARILGRYPTLGAYAVFSEAMFDLATRSQAEAGRPDPVEIGCDVARFGDDATTFHVRRGPESLEHDSARKQDTGWTAGRLKELARKWGEKFDQDPKQIKIKVDDTGVGGGVVDQRGEYRFVPVNACWTANDSERYPNVRSEMLFDLADTMKSGAMSLRHLPASVRFELQRQAISVKYKLDSKGKRVASPKDKIKEELGRSPDDLDAWALAYYRPPSVGIAGPATTAPPEKRDIFKIDRDRTHHRKLFT